MYIPKNALQLREVKVSQWMQHIGNLLTELRELSRFECQIRFLGEQTFIKSFN